MPLRPRDRTCHTVVMGVDLNARSDPLHHSVLEAMMTGKYCPFSRLSPETAGVDDHGLPVFYSSLWNLGVVSLSGSRPPRVRNVCDAIRSFADNSPLSLQDVISILCPEPEDDGKDVSIADEVDIPEEVLLALEEEGILREESRRAIPALIHMGNLRSRDLYSGVFCTYGPERRKLVGRVLNCINIQRNR